MSRGKEEPPKKLVFGLHQVCPRCKGTGKKIGKKEVCGACKGSRVTLRENYEGA